MIKKCYFSVKYIFLLTSSTNCIRLFCRTLSLQYNYIARRLCLCQSIKCKIMAVIYKHFPAFHDNFVPNPACLGNLFRFHSVQKPVKISINACAIHYNLFAGFCYYFCKQRNFSGCRLKNLLVYIYTFFPRKTHRIQSADRQSVCANSSRTVNESATWPQESFRIQHPSSCLKSG